MSHVYSIVVLSVSHSLQCLTVTTDSTKSLQRCFSKSTKAERGKSHFCALALDIKEKTPEKKGAKLIQSFHAFSESIYTSKDGILSSSCSAHLILHVASKENYILQHSSSRFLISWETAAGCYKKTKNTYILLVLHKH